jgi:hypothetical protein
MRSLLLGIALAVLPTLVSAQVEDGYAGQRGFEFRKKQLAERASARVQVRQFRTAAWAKM